MLEKAPIINWLYLIANGHLLSFNKQTGDWLKWWAIKVILRLCTQRTIYIDLDESCVCSTNSSIFNRWCNMIFLRRNKKKTLTRCERHVRFGCHVYGERLRSMWRLCTLTLDRRIRWLILVHIVITSQMHHLIWPALWQLATWASHVMPFAWV